MRTVSFLSILAITLGPSVLRAQDTRLHFEVASVRPSGPVPPRTPVAPGGNILGGPGTNDPGNIRYERVPFQQLIMAAYGVQRDQIKGPGWATTEDFSEAARFDISAKVPPGTTKEQVATMLQNLLGERFRMSLHHETANVPGYAVVVAKGGSKLKESRGPVIESERWTIPSPGGQVKRETEKDGFPQLFPSANMGGQFKDGVVRNRFRDYPLSDLAQQLSSTLAAHVIDRTALRGKYDFTLEFTPPENGSVVGIAAAFPIYPGQTAPLSKNGPLLAQLDAVPIISSAMEKQLGLKLESTKIPVDTLVIDHVEKIRAYGSTGELRSADRELRCAMRTVSSLSILAMTLGSSILPAQDAKLQFEVASVRPSGAVPPGTPQFPGGRIIGGPGTNDPGNIRYERVPFQELIMAAYGVQRDQIKGPGWATTDDFSEAARFDISAKVPPGTTKEQAAMMLQNLLAQRFRMSLHNETVQFPGYALVVAKGGSKLKESRGPLAGSERKEPTPGPVKLQIEKDGFPQLFPGVNMGGTFKDGVVRIRFRDYPLFDLSQQLAFALAVRLTDRTGLNGKYDFTLEVTPPENGMMIVIPLTLPLNSGQIVPANKNGPNPIQQDAVPIISSAMEKQLGLKLEATKIPVDTLVIDHVEKTPTAN